MITSGNEQFSLHEKKASLADAAAAINTASQQQVLLPNKFITHHPKAGINPLVDSAAYLFSAIGKLKQVSSYRHLRNLHQVLVQEINTFQDTSKAHGYSSEYVLVARYALCVTFDDIIANTAWGAQGLWENHSLLATLNQEPSQ